MPSLSDLHRSGDISSWNNFDSHLAISMLRFYTVMPSRYKSYKVNVIVERLDLHRHVRGVLDGQSSPLLVANAHQIVVLFHRRHFTIHF